jgi:hypothetical protein
VETFLDLSQWAGAITIILLAAYGALHLVFGIIASSEPWGPEAPEHKDRKGSGRV